MVDRVNGVEELTLRGLETGEGGPTYGPGLPVTTSRSYK